MNLDDQLDELRTNILRDVSDLDNGGLDDRRFSDKSLLLYIKDAEARFARETQCILDSSTPGIATISLVSGVSTYKCHKSVFSIASARFQDSVTNLSRIGQSAIRDNIILESETFNDPSVIALNPGSPLAFYTDETVVFAGGRSVTLSVYPEPSAAEAGKIVYLRVFRTPITEYTIKSQDRESEILEDFQLDVLHWAAYRALSHFDTDEGATIPSDKHAAAFEDAIRKAKSVMRKRLFVPVRVEYGRNGFSYN